MKDTVSTCQASGVRFQVFIVRDLMSGYLLWLFMRSSHLERTSCELVSTSKLSFGIVLACEWLVGHIGDCSIS